MASAKFLVTFKADSDARAIIETAVGHRADVVYLADLDGDARRQAIAAASVVLARNTAKELLVGEASQLTRARLVQYVSAGIDFIPLAEFPDDLAIAGNGGGYAEPMAEHAVMMALAAMKRLLSEHRKLAEGTFDQFRPNRMLAGSVCGILGFGGIGKATARLMRALGAEIHAVNRSGVSDEAVDWIDSMSGLDTLLTQADVLVLSLPLTPTTLGLLGSRELKRMKRDAILINLARGEIVDEAALFQHLCATPSFTACIDAWWVEPVRHGEFRSDHPFMELANVIASPHNSASVAGWSHVALRRATENACRVLDGDEARFCVAPEDRMA